MPTAFLPRNCTLAALAASFGEAGALAGDGPAVVVQVADDGFLDVGAMAFLCTWARAKVVAGSRIHLRGDDDALRYLARMDLHEHLGLAYDPGARRDETGRFLPLKLIASEDDVYATANAICDLVLHQFDNAGAFIPALEWAVNEILDNILMHAESLTPDAVCAQYFPQTHRLDVGIADMGRGIMASLGTTRKLWSHGDAVTTALRRGVTRDPTVGQGNGMAGALEIARLNGGTFEVWTGDVVYRLDGGKERGFTKIPTLPGTGVRFSLDTRQPVDLAQTWIAGGDWSFINVEAERIADQGGVDVAQACLHTGGRPPAQRLRRKLAAVLPELDGPLVLDFSGVRSASSSFLDELLGRLADDLGREQFEDRVRCIGMDPTLRKMANVVIAQRLDGLGDGVAGMIDEREENDA